MDKYENAVRVAAHRGNSKYFPENTMPAYESALTLPVDQIEIDLHMTRDGEIIMMHDARVDRTTDGTGAIRDFTAAEIKSLDAGRWKGEQFAGTRVPLFSEFLDLMDRHPDMTVNVELKDYPRDDREWAIESCNKAIAMLESHNMAQRIWINCFSAELLEYIDREYGHKYRLHGYYPHDLMSGEQTRDPYDYLHCVCLFGTKEKPVVSKSEFDRAKSRGVEPWCYFSDDSTESMDAAIEHGVMLFTSNDPKFTCDYLRAKNLHK